MYNGALVHRLFPLFGEEEENARLMQKILGEFSFSCLRTLPRVKI